MTNLWAFLLQTLSVSAAAVLLLAMKRLFADKLSPRWQYGVWCLLALRVLLPVSTSWDTLLPLPVWVEAAKTAAEQRLSSAYSAPYAPVSASAPFPWLMATPRSVTDWLFVLYTVGVVLSLLWYALSYVRLRRLLRFGLPLTEELEGQLGGVCQRYGLRARPALRLEGLSSAFVCGVFRPVLVLPAERDVDDKVLLHELLHLRHRDALQNVFWCLLRGLHWCNPFLQYVFDRIGNDMEALCDQRVLERLQGEDRRAYGKILLSMADETYARAPGTTSLSNGGKNIARRIAAIVRFKQYPRGMALVSVCIVAVLTGPVLVGTASGYTDTDTAPSTDAALNLSMARTRLVGCSTVAGALDTYAKGLLLENGIYLAAASPPGAAGGAASGHGGIRRHLPAVRRGGAGRGGAQPGLLRLRPDPDGGRLSGRPALCHGGGRGRGGDRLCAGARQPLSGSQGLGGGGERSAPDRRDRARPACCPLRSLRGERLRHPVRLRVLPGGQLHQPHGQRLRLEQQRRL
ncbi:MAG: M56 family metallopeptidase [Clostridiales bacterium]|nr:M56 family metallopeptidase [Clostridiales bacterium]